MSHGAKTGHYTKVHNIHHLLVAHAAGSKTASEQYKSWLSKLIVSVLQSLEVCKGVCYE